MICRNDNTEMVKALDPITFTPTPRNRAWWKCPKCGAKIPRVPDDGELDEKPTVFSSESRDWRDDYLKS